jgi:hypothetical protein
MPPYVTIDNMFDQLPRIIPVRDKCGACIGVIDFSVKASLEDGPAEEWIEGHFRSLVQPDMAPVEVDL